MTNSKPTRLNKVARELNVGISTIVDFLSEKGHEIASNPNTKIGPEIYAMLLEEFQDDQAKKEEALNAISHEEKQTISIEDKGTKKPLRKKDSDELMIKNIENVSDEEIIKPKVEEQDVKVVGKIDLDSMNTKTKPEKEKKEAEEKKEEGDSDKEQKTESKTEEPKEDKVDKKEDVETIETKYEKLDGPNIVGKIDLPEKKEKKKKPVASSSEDTETGKRKRKRISKQKVDKGDDRQQRRGGKGRKKREEKPELDEEQIQAQIKETLARLSGGGKSKAAKYRRAKRDAQSEQREEELKQQEEKQKVLEVTEFVTANELAAMMDASVNEVISVCMELGMFVSINQRLDAETLSIVADEFGYEIEFIAPEETEGIVTEEEDDEKDLQARPPIVTVMGHVDHGKTSLLDHIRSANVIAGEAGGITQHIGAYSVALDSGKKITFLDTPGHEAFTAMRARGAQVTDIAIIVIAADDKVMPQTKEAINHAQAAGVPMVFAINKIDKPGANPDKIKEELSGMNLLVEDWGGKYQSQDISAKQGTNMKELLEKVLLEAELLELKANPNRNASGVVIESELDKGRGYVSTILVQKGTLRKGDIIVAGSYSGRVKAMHNERGQEIEEAGPATPVELLGLNGAPSAGDTFNVLQDEKEAKNIATKRMQLQREQGMRTKKHITLDEIGRRLAIGDFQELNVIVKGDVDGSIEALADSMLKLSTEKIQVNVIHKSVGQISESDVLLASASDAIIIGFQVRPSVSARQLAEKEEIDIRLYSVIYDAIEELKAAMEGMLKPTEEERIVGNIEVREVFKISKVGTVAGCYVLDGKVHRNNKVRVIRDGIVVYEGNLGSLKRFKDDVKEVATGYECGLNIENFNDIKVGDIIEGYEIVEVEQKL